MNWWLELLGFTAGTLGVISFIPQVVKSWKTKKTGDISLPMYVILSSCIFLWVIYGILTKQIALTLTNGISFILTISVLLAKLRFG